MLFHFRRRMAALFPMMIVVSGNFALAQTPVKAPLPVVKQGEIARAERRPARNVRPSGFSSEKKKSKNFAYSYLLPFGVGQFERDKAVMGTALATGQAGFLLLYFDRLNAVRSSNADAADVMRGITPSSAASDPGIVAFLDSNEKFTLQAQQQANMALIGFFALYTAGVVEAVFDPLGRVSSRSSSPKKKRRDVDFSENPQPEGTRDGNSQLVQDLRDEEKTSKIGVFVAPTAAGTSPTVGLSLQKPF